jgi:long-chain fatty acid transport protein
MGGAGVAHAEDAIGAVHWNPATITALSGTELSLGIDLFVPSSTLRSTERAGAVGGVFPPVDRAGETDARTRIYPIPAAAIVFDDDDSKLAYALGLFATAGFGVEYGEDPTNPVLSPQPFGFGRVETFYVAAQIVPTIAYEITENVSVGVAPVVNWQRLSIEPFLLGPRDFYAGPLAPPIYRPGENSASAFGIGVQAGVYYHSDEGVELGFSYKSPQKFSALEFEGVDALGREQTVEFPLDYPAIVSAGVGYRGDGPWGFAADVRYIFYEGVDGFETLPLAPGGGVQGLGWRNIWAAATGFSYKLDGGAVFRGGYSFAQRAMPDEVALFNAATPTIVKHKLAGGVSVPVWNDFLFNFTYTHNFENELRGPRFGPGAPEALGIVQTTASGNGFLFGLQKRF